VWVHQKIKNIIWKKKEKKIKTPSNQHPQKTRNFFLNKNDKKKSELKSLLREGETDTERERERREEKRRSLAQTGSRRSGPARKLQVGEWVGE